MKRIEKVSPQIKENDNISIYDLEKKLEKTSVSSVSTQFLKDPCMGIITDLRKRLPRYCSDWLDGLNMKILSSALLMYFASIAPALTFGEYLVNKTNKSYGVTEVLMSTSLTGCLYAIFSGQPLVIVGVTGPVSIFSITNYTICETFGVDFLQWMFWTCIWSGIMHIILSIINGVNFVFYVSRFSCEIFGILIAIIYIVSGIEDFIDFFYEETIDVALLSLIIGLATFILSINLNDANRWIYFRNSIRTVISDYGPSLTIIFMTGVSYIGKLNEVKLNRLSKILPDGFGTSSGRSWFVNPCDENCEVWIIFATILPGLILTVLFFFDHNVSSLLTQRSEFNLKKESAYHWDFFIIGIMIIICGFLGIPPTNGLIPQAPLHVRTLAILKEEEVQGFKKTKYVHVYETRLSGLFQSIMIGLTLLILNVIGTIPISILSGIFLFMGFNTFEGNQFADRIKLFFNDKNLMPPFDYVKCLNFKTIAKFTSIQILLLGIIYGITWTPAAISFPVFILLLVPIRLILLKKLFSKEEIELLDREGDSMMSENYSKPMNSMEKIDTSLKEEPKIGDRE